MPRHRAHGRTCRTPSAPGVPRGTPGAPTSRALEPLARPTRDGHAALQLFSNRILQRMMRQGKLGIHLLQPRVLGFELLQSAKLRDIQTAVAGFPVIEGRVADAVLAHQLRHLHTRLGLLQDRDDSFFGKPRLLHSSSPSQENSTPKWSCASGGYNKPPVPAPMIRTSGLLFMDKTWDFN